jgi:3-oxoacyl-[acyl-carrier protein] reductase
VDLGLTDRVVIVTGASAGIGAAVARALAVEGARIALVARREDRLRHPSDELTAVADRPFVLPCDLAEPSAARRVRDEVVDRFGTVHGLVNAAGGSRPVSVDAPEDVWTEALAVNFHGLRRLSHAVLTPMRAQRSGSIVNVTGSLEPKSLNAANAAKAAVHAWAKGVSRDLGPYGITVNSVSPGRIMSEQIVEHIYPTEDDRRAFAEAHIPLGRFGEPHEIADLIVFLTSPRAGYISGEIVHVDGGLRRHAF